MIKLPRWRGWILLTLTGGFGGDHLGLLCHILTFHFFQGEVLLFENFDLKNYCKNEIGDKTVSHEIDFMASDLYRPSASVGVKAIEIFEPQAVSSTVCSRL